jgi:transposase InsO family protein
MPAHALSEAERAAIIALANEPRFAETPPARIVPALADEGIYIASESSFYRVLRAHGQMNRRGRAQPPRTSRPPTTHIATRPGEVWCWDLTFLPAQVQGCWFYFYLILDLYSRKIVGFEVHDGLCCMDMRRDGAGTQFPQPNMLFKRYGHSSGVRAPASGSWPQQQWQPRSPRSGRCAIEAHRR